MAWFRNQFLKVVEYKEDDKDLLVYRYPMPEKAEIMKDSKIVVRESQNAVFVHKGQVADVFAPGTHNLTTENIPIITSLMSWKYLFETPIKADVYYVNMRQFTDEKWGTVNPIIVRDKDFGIVRVRGFGKYSFRVSDPSTFLKELFGTSMSYSRQDISSYLRSILVSAITDTVAESKIPVLDMAANTLEFNELVKTVIKGKFESLGLSLVDFFIENISVPEEVEKAMDTRSSMGVMGDKMNEFVKFQAANAMVDAANNPSGGLAGAGVGLGAGVSMGQLFAEAMKPTPQAPVAPSVDTVACKNCGEQIAKTAKFCSHCGAKTAEEIACPTCGASVSNTAKFCPECGTKLGAITCKGCGAEFKAGTKFCPECGQKVE